MNINLPASNDTLLVQLEREGMTIESHCRSGLCGVCRCKLVKGKVSYQEDPIAFRKDGEVLACCATATSDVTVEI